VIRYRMSNVSVKDTRDVDLNAQKNVDDMQEMGYNEIVGLVIHIAPTPVNFCKGTQT